MKQIYLKLVCFTLIQTSNLYAQVTTFPYVNDLKGATPSHVIGVPGKDQLFTENGILLTNNLQSQSGAVVFDLVSFTSSQGLSIEFEYDMYGIDENSTTLTNDYADGICVFLYDATAPLVDLIGANGGALSYLYTKDPNDLQPGLNKAYLGVGFDQWRNFKRRLTASGLVDNDFVNPYSQVTIRGAMRHEPIGADAVDAQGNPTSNISSNPAIYNNPRYQGYPVLFSRTTNYPSGLLNRAGIRGKVLDMNNNSSTSVNYNDILTNYDNKIMIRGGKLNPPVTSSAYRKVIITLGPADPAIGGGYYITIDLYSGTNHIRVIEDFHYKEQFFYNENTNSLLAYPYEESIVYSINATIPQEFKIGFGASTGSFFQYQLIKNLIVDLAYRARFEPDYVKFCENAGPTTHAIVDVFANDFVYNGPIYGPPSEGTGPEYIDYTSFKFTNGDNFPFTELGTWNGDDFVYVDANEGIWSFSKITGKVTFTPNINFSGKATIYYTAKGTASQGGPFNQDDYYAIPEEIVVEETKCGGFINPQLPFKSENIFTN